MFNSAVLNVVVGLILIFLLYSLLATIVGEMISYWFGIRPRILRMAIERMLNDGYYKKYFPAKIIISKSGKAVRNTAANKTSRYLSSLWQRISYIVLLRTPKAFPSSFAGKFYDSPSIKSLARLEADQKGLFGISKPSYLSAENFSETLCHILEEGGSGKTPYDKIIFCIKYNTLQIQPETARHIANLIKDSPDINAFRLNLQRWFNETMDRAHGWYKSKMQAILLCLGFLIAWCFNIDTIKIAHILSRDRDAGKQLTSIAIATTKDTVHYNPVTGVHADSTLAKTILDSSIAQVNKNIADEGLILGLGWELDSLRTKDTEKIKKSTDARIYQEALQYYNSLQILYKAYPVQENALAATLQKLDSSTQVLYHLQRDTLNNAILNRDNDSSKAALLFTLKAVNAYKKLKSLDSAEVIATQYRIAQQEQHILNMVESDILQVDTITASGDVLEISGKRNYSFGEKIWFILWAHPRSWMRFLGFLLTALAISIGAPFWFDLLNKLVNIRIAGAKPREKKDAATDTTITVPAHTTDTVQSVTSPEDPVDEALRIYKTTVLKENGVIRADKGYMQTKEGYVVACVQIDVEDQQSALNVRSKYPSFTLSNNETVAVNVLITGKVNLSGGATTTAATVSGNPEKALSNNTLLLGWGSYGCLVESVDFPGQYFIVSCYHVMNGEYTWTNNGISKTINNLSGTVANMYQGFLTDLFDTAYAPVASAIYQHYKSGMSCTQPQGTRDVTANDLFKTIVKIQGLTTTLATGIVVNFSKPMTFPYPVSKTAMQEHQLQDLVVISHYNNTPAQNFVGTTFGDSGAVVLDENNIAIGLVVGSDLLHTYVIKINSIFNQFGFKLA